ncbi:MAG: hypothetical protein J7K51_08960 [Thermotogae bacterium]|nr:hypothetical protein [Thermotogota bacterium]
MRRFKLEIVQLKPILGMVNENFERILGEIDDGIKLGADLICFPDTALSGWELSSLLKEVLIEKDSEKWEVLKSRSKRISIVISFLEREKDNYFKSVSYLEDGKVLYIHKRLFTDHESIPKDNKEFHTKFGNVMLLTYADLTDPRTVFKSKEHIDMIIVPSAVYAEGMDELGENISSVEKFKLLCKALSIRFHSIVIAVNRVGFEDGYGFFGASSVINSEGRVIYSLQKFSQERAILHIDLDSRSFKAEPL